MKSFGPKGFWPKVNETWSFNFKGTLGISLLSIKLEGTLGNVEIHICHMLGNSWESKGEIFKDLGNNLCYPTSPGRPSSAHDGSLPAAMWPLESNTTMPLREQNKYWILIFFNGQWILVWIKMHTKLLHINKILLINYFFEEVSLLSCFLKEYCIKPFDMWLIIHLHQLKKNCSLVIKLLDFFVFTYCVVAAYMSFPWLDKELLLKWERTNKLYKFIAYPEQ